MNFDKKRKNKLYKVEEGYDLYAHNYDYTLKFLDSFEGDFLKKELKGIKGLKVLDLGAGTGRLTGFLLEQGGEIWTLDKSEKMLQILAKKYRKAHIVLGDALKMPFEPERFDLVVAAFLIVHVRDLLELFDEIYRVMKPGGKLVLSNINQRKPPKSKINQREEIFIQSYYHRPKDVVAKLNEAFFKIESEEFLHDGEVWINQIIVAKK